LPQVGAIPGNDGPRRLRIFSVGMIRMKCAVCGLRLFFVLGPPTAAVVARVSSLDAQPGQDEPDEYEPGDNGNHESQQIFHVFSASRRVCRGIRPRCGKILLPRLLPHGRLFRQARETGARKGFRPQVFRSGPGRRGAWVPCRW